MMGTQTAIFGGGCFWCLEAVYQGLRGVLHVTSGYMGGHLTNPSYQAVCTTDTGHAEVVRIEFDPSVIDYTRLLDVFFAIHDPTTLNRQGNDVGPQYRSVIFAMNQAQHLAAREKIAAMAPHYSSPLVTELIAAFDAQGNRLTATDKTFWTAELEHQNYFRTHPGQGYCAFVVAPKVAKAEREFRELLA